MEIRQFGNPTGKKLLLLHGNLMCWRQFEDVIPLLEKAFCVYAVSFDGFDGTGTTVYTTAQEQALETVHSYVERRAHHLKRIFLRLMRIPGLYRRVPGIFPGRPRGFSEPPPASRPEKFRRPTASGASI